MKKTSVCLCALLVFLAFASFAYAVPKAPAAPVSALFYPNEILLTVEEKIAPTPVQGKGKSLCIVLPQGNVQNFSATVNGAPVAAFHRLENETADTATTSAQENDQERKALLLAVENLETERYVKEAAIKTAETRLALWQQRQPRKDGLSPEEMVALDAAYAERLPQIYAGLSNDKRALETLRNDFEKARTVLLEFDAKRQDNVIAIPYDGPEGKTALVRYTYIIPGSCGSTYNLTAYPAKGLLKIAQEAVLFQQSGRTWNDVDVYISTTRRDTSMRPSVIAPWRVDLFAKDVPAPAPMQRSRVSEIQASQVNVSEARMEKMVVAPPQAPTQEEMGTFRLWSLGKRTIETDMAVTLPLATDEYKAGYFYTLQPAYNAKGYLTAELNLAKALELPAGKARLFVDDVAVGEQTMSLNGTKAFIYFGTDPQVTATMRDVKQSKGEQGFISKEQNRVWHWEITVRNSRGRPVDVWVFDPIPNARDNAIKVAVDSKPKPEETVTARQLGSTAVYRWKFALQPGESKIIDHKVQLTAPADKVLSAGRR
ncbi:MAG: hypothetical protein DELT_00593 [Desulfovibrio sp.]